MSLIEDCYKQRVQEHKAQCPLSQEAKFLASYAKTTLHPSETPKEKTIRNMLYRKYSTNCPKTPKKK
jgi:hypothetical protein